MGVELKEQISFGHYNQNMELKDTKILCRAEKTSRVIMILLINSIYENIA